MVKRREPKASTLNLVTKQPTQEQIEAFAAAAEGKIWDFRLAETFTDRRVSRCSLEFGWRAIADGGNASPVRILRPGAES